MNSYISLKSWTIRLGRAAAAIVASRDFDWAALQAVGGIMISMWTVRVLYGAR